MTESEALGLLSRLVQADTEPTLSPEELADCLFLARCVDESGLAPSDPDWTPTWDLNKAAAEGWRRKAAKVVTAYDVQADDAKLSRSQMFKQFMQMAKLYANKSISVVRMTSGYWAKDNER